MELMAEQYPSEFSQVAHRRVRDVRIINLSFWLVVVWETLAAILLCVGAFLLSKVALLGGDVTLARDIALAGALAFTVNWAGLLIGGNYFCYYFCHFEGQFTHFLLVIWGSLVTGLHIVLSSGAFLSSG